MHRHVLGRDSVGIIARPKLVHAEAREEFEGDAGTSVAII